ncbi:hypothetical protein [Chitinasiproducens palmae]|uniref:Uncharacterized protein n=1 Tax=Chitinasiproducens palmae TaxID=1770053 RepID=A0A1H2PS79_9BURK|nr:hypothetical protein [Chitinasiproducens palmae]SDV49815.1 hypothetical protein SAMN05216551_109161 [Chitinasiproducens palmae]
MKVTTTRPILLNGKVGVEHDTTEQHARELRAKGLLAGLAAESGEPPAESDEAAKPVRTSPGKSSKQ